jgi:hypothetical protein
MLGIVGTNGAAFTFKVPVAAPALSIQVILFFDL